MASATAFAVSRIPQTPGERGVELVHATDLPVFEEPDGGGPVGLQMPAKTCSQWARASTGCCTGGAPIYGKRVPSKLGGVGAPGTGDNPHPGVGG